MNVDDIKSLVLARAAESTRLEFKRDLPGPKDSDKNEFLADVSAFANLAGGTLIFGVSERERCADAIVGVEIPDADKTTLWFDSILRSGIEPRIPNLNIEILNVDGLQVLVVSVPPSVARPHWVSARGERRFYIRTTAGKSPMSIDEVRSAFQLSGEVRERAEQWRSASLARHRELLQVSQRLDKMWMVVGICPLSAFGGSGIQYDARPARRHEDRLPSIGSTDTNCRPSYEGLLTEERDPQGFLRHRLLVRRDFRIETVWQVGGTHDIGGRDPAKILYAGSNETILNRWMAQFIQWATKVDFPVPALVFLSVLNASQSAIMSSFSNYQATGDTLELTSCFLEELTQEPSLVLRPAYDHLWQAYGFDRCVLYQEDGTFDGNYDRHRY